MSQKPTGAAGPAEWKQAALKILDNLMKMVLSAKAVRESKIHKRIFVSKESDAVFADSAKVNERNRCLELVQTSVKANLISSPAMFVQEVREVFLNYLRFYINRTDDVKSFRRLAYKSLDDFTTLAVQSNPPLIDASKPRLDDRQKGHCRRGYEKILDVDGAETALYFLRDPETYGETPNYNKHIVKKSWLSLVLTNLESDRYKTIREFASDIYLIFQNCYDFNQTCYYDVPDLLDRAKRCLDAFNNEMQSAGLQPYKLIEDEKTARERLDEKSSGTSVSNTHDSLARVTPQASNEPKKSKATPKVLKGKAARQSKKKNKGSEDEDEDKDDDEDEDEEGEDDPDEADGISSMGDSRTAARRRSGSTSASLDTSTISVPDSLNEVMRRELEKAIDRVIRRSEAKLFLRPVDLKKVKNYFSFVKRPMDFETLKKRLNPDDKEHWKRLSEFKEAAELIFSNSRAYNEGNAEALSATDKCDTIWHDEFEKAIEKYKQTKARTTAGGNAGGGSSGEKKARSGSISTTSKRGGGKADSPAIAPVVARKSEEEIAPVKLDIDYGLKMTDALVTKLESLLKAACTWPESRYFIEPVPWKNMEWLDYPQVCPNPMDLGTLLKNLRSKRYHTLGAFLKDEGLIFRNCRAFNFAEDPELPILTWASKVELRLKNEIEKIVKVLEISKNLGSTPSSLPVTNSSSAPVVALKPLQPSSQSSAAPKSTGIPLIKIKPLTPVAEITEASKTPVHPGPSENPSNKRVKMSEASPPDSHKTTGQTTKPAPSSKSLQAIPPSTKSTQSSVGVKPLQAVQPATNAQSAAVVVKSAAKPGISQSTTTVVKASQLSSAPSNNVQGVVKAKFIIASRALTPQYFVNPVDFTFKIPPKSEFDLIGQHEEDLYTALSMVGKIKQAAVMFGLPVLDVYRDDEVFVSTYRSHVQHPMDLQTMFIRLSKHDYTDPTIADKDAHLMFGNAIYYNKAVDDQTMVQRAEHFQSFWNDIYCEYFGASLKDFPPGQIPAGVETKEQRAERRDRIVLKLKASHATCLEVLKRLLASPDKSNFMMPVISNDTHLPDYRKIVKEPRDLGTIRNTASRNQYAIYRDFVRDCRLVFSNCLLYNPDTPENRILREQAMRMSDLFETEWRRKTLGLYERALRNEDEDRRRRLERGEDLNDEEEDDDDTKPKSLDEILGPDPDDAAPSPRRKRKKFAGDDDDEDDVPDILDDEDMPTAKRKRGRKSTTARGGDEIVEDDGEHAFMRKTKGRRSSNAGAGMDESPIRPGRRPRAASLSGRVGQTSLDLSSGGIGMGEAQGMDETIEGETLLGQYERETEIQVQARQDALRSHRTEQRRNLTAYRDLQKQTFQMLVKTLLERPDDQQRSLVPSWSSGENLSGQSRTIVVETNGEDRSRNSNVSEEISTSMTLNVSRPSKRMIKPTASLFMSPSSSMPVETASKEIKPAVRREIEKAEQQNLIKQPTDLAIRTHHILMEDTKDINGQWVMARVFKHSFGKVDLYAVVLRLANMAETLTSEFPEGSVVAKFDGNEGGLIATAQSSFQRYFELRQPFAGRDLDLADAVASVMGSDTAGDLKWRVMDELNCIASAPTLESRGLVDHHSIYMAFPSAVRVNFALGGSSIKGAVEI